MRSVAVPWSVGIRTLCIDAASAMVICDNESGVGTTSSGLRKNELLNVLGGGEEEVRNRVLRRRQPSGSILLTYSSTEAPENMEERRGCSRDCGC